MFIDTIETISQLPIPIRVFRWLAPRKNTWMLTVVCKATFQLLPTQAELAADQEPIHDQDRFWNDDEQRSVRASSDLAPFKIRADVTLVGMAYAPPPHPVRSFVARLIVGTLDKSIEVFCDRAVRLDGTLHEGPRITRMALHYERAAGGFDTENPVGIRQGTRDPYGNAKIPNLQPLALNITSAADFVPPINFGPLAAHWPSRARKRGTKRIDDELPEDVDVAYFNVAPLDQQIELLRADERIVLDNLHPNHPHLVTSLPGLYPNVVFSGRAGGPQTITMRPDTLGIDTERGSCTLTFRGQLPLLAKDEKGKIIAVLERLGEASSPLNIEKKVATQIPNELDADLLRTVTISADILSQHQALPFAKSAAEHTAIFVPPIDLDQAWDPSSGATIDIRISKSGEVLPFAAAAQEIKAPPLIFAPPEPAASEPPSPWVANSTRASSPDLGTAVPADASASRSGFTVPAAPGKTIGETLVTTNNPSDSLDEKAAVEPPAPLLSNDETALLVQRAPIVLVWLDRKSLPRITRKPAYQSILEALEQEAVDPDADDPALSKDPTEIQDKAHALEILARAKPLRFHQLVASLERASKRRGQVAAPIERCDGELSLAFDEFELLRATMATTRLSGTGNDPLLAALKQGSDFFDIPGHSFAPAMATLHTNKIREAFMMQPSTFPKDQLDTFVHRGLAEQRKYHLRRVFGGKYLRGLLQMEDQRRPVPVYLPAALEEDLPLLSRFAVSLLVEVHLPIDAFDEQPIALKAVAMARRVEMH